MGKKGVPQVDSMAYVPAKVVDTTAVVIVPAAAGVIVPAAAFAQKGQVRLEHLEPKYKNRFWMGHFEFTIYGWV